MMVRPATIVELLELRRHLAGKESNKKSKKLSGREREALRKLDEHLLAVAESLSFAELSRERVE